MKLQLSLSLIIVSLMLPTSGCAHMSDPCDNKLLNRVPSPDGSLTLATYHRECPSIVLTVATVEKKPAGFSRSRGEVVCYLISWGGRHPVEAVWKTEDSIFISTTHRLEKLDFHDSKESCSGITVNYGVQFRNERQQADDPEVISKIRGVISGVGPCIDRYYKAGYPTNDPVGEVNKLVERGEHRSAVELLLGYTSDAACPLSPATYDSIKGLSETFDLKPVYLERVTPLVRR